MTLRKNDRLPPEVSNLANSIGHFVQYWGFKSVHAKIWTLLYLSEKPLSATEMSKRLEVSKTLLSFSIAELLNYEVIQKKGTGTRRTIYFVANPNITSVILNVLRMREHPMMSDINSSVDQVRALTKKNQLEFGVNPDRLHTLGALISAAKEALLALILHTDPDSDLIHQFLVIAGALVPNLTELPVDRSCGNSSFDSPLT